MNLTKLKRSLSVPANLYLTSLCIVGTLIFILNLHWFPTSPSDWVLIYALALTVIILNQITIPMPPEGNSLSMDSALYMAVIFTFGIQFSLNVLLISAIVFTLYQRKVNLWKHAANFSSYSLMLVAAYITFIQTGGEVGPIETKQLFPYIISLAIYFLVNVLLVGFFYLIKIKGNFLDVLRGFFKETITAYISTLLLSLVLSIMFKTNLYFSLFLFVCISVLLSVSFKKLFELYQEVSEKSIRDQRTGLYNHGYFEDILEKELIQAKASATSFSLAILDVDNFKKYNDTLGHFKGDQLLGFFGALLLKECKSANYTVARYGGDEFTILMPNTSERVAFSFINGLRKKINDSYYEGTELFSHGCLSFSAGIIEYAKGIYNKSQLLDKADQAMYYAKAQGKNLVHIYNEQSLFQKTIDIEQDIHEIEQQLKIFLSKDVYTFQHSKRVFSYAMDICDYVALNDSEKKILILGALFHDIGKLEVPKHILKKTGKLSAEEWETVKRHVEWGKDIVSTIDKYKELIPLVELHHERMDGKGYPYGLIGEEIPKLARLLCVIDSFDAMTTERPYQKTKSFDEAIHEMRRCAGFQFDAIFVESFIEMIMHKYDFKLDAFSSASI
ncbi:diguanylate cyclase [Paenibacillus psychroresistens]|uniref:Diguanylate cyclase n=1 Tax=Paenibacillus psychroresistens TaxID=1778678 RepID=A0A6B8RBN1_9BACL|nr:diguanylate cyclase [Paenibacillus psychroresistens]QGQ93971.1 diguanylate cyclase [Paenibacillus psychroresistens]